MMAHNEEETIAAAIESILFQKREQESTLEIHIFANACNDKTEEIVANIAKNNKSIYLHSLSEKGKVASGL